jgi:hypothetical protein
MMSRISAGIPEVNEDGPVGRAGVTPDCRELLPATMVMPRVEGAVK